jgi:hypothetical protein
VLFGLAVLVVGAKLGGLVVERFGQPSVLDELAFPMPPKLPSGDSTQKIRATLIPFRFYL